MRTRTRFLSPARTRSGAPGSTRRRATPVLAAAAALLAAPLTATPASASTTVQRAPVMAFQPAGDHGGGVLQAGTTFAPKSAGAATLRRGTDWVALNMQTSGLPEGAYTVWWVVFNTPAGCSMPGCGENDLQNPAAETSVFYATGGVVGHNGVATFKDRYADGDPLGTPGQQHILGDGELDPQEAEVHNIVRYHGPASADPDTLHGQTHTLLGSCDSGANAHDLGDPFGVQCFDPQAVGFPAP